MSNINLFDFIDEIQDFPKKGILFRDISPLLEDKDAFKLLILKMMHQIDLQLIAAYCNEISLYIETEIMLREKGRIQIFKNSDGTLKHAQAVPYQKIAKDALDKAMKLATQFGLTPVARASISAPKITNNTQINYFDSSNKRK